MTSRRILLAIAMVGAFLTGILVGGWVVRECLWQRGNSTDWHQRLMATFSRQLHLTPEQQQEISQILQTGHFRMRSLHDQVRPQFEALRNETRQQIRAVLTPEQAKKFTAMEEEFAKRHERFRNKRFHWDD